jgi:hypothetical protein
MIPSKVVRSTATESPKTDATAGNYENCSFPLSPPFAPPPLGERVG